VKVVVKSDRDRQTISGTSAITARINHTMHLRDVNSERNKKGRELPVDREDAINQSNYLANLDIAGVQLACSRGVLHRPLACQQH
jgi:hypothetical protein